MTQLDRLAERLSGLEPKGRRGLVAIAGPPGAGKSTLADALATRIGDTAVVVPMDGFHLDNAILGARGLSARKGAPQTFDVDGLTHLMGRLADEDEIVFPIFDRDADLAIAGSGVVGPAHEIVLVEGNYLLLDQPGWRDLRPLWDLAVFIAVDTVELADRLVRRWRDHGLSEAEARDRANGNDLPNARLVAESAVRADLFVTPDGTLSEAAAIGHHWPATSS